jgi:GNAT superfamily N-acetyltransferase
VSNSTDNFQIRLATPDDAVIIARQRAAMFYDVGSVSASEREQIAAEAIAQIQQMIRCGDYYGWLVEGDDIMVAGGGVILRQLLPRPGSLQGGEEAYILNVYVHPQYRRRGLARRLMQAILLWSEQCQCVRIALHASEAGEPLYISLGFERTTELRLQSKLPQA